MESFSKLTKKLENYTFTGDLYPFETLINKIIQTLPKDERHSKESRRTIIEWKEMLPTQESQELQLMQTVNSIIKPTLIRCCKSVLRKDKIIKGDARRRRSNSLGITFVKETKVNKRKYDPWRDG